MLRVVGCAVDLVFENLFWTKIFLVFIDNGVRQKVKYVLHCLVFKTPVNNGHTAGRIRRALFKIQNLKRNPFVDLLHRLEGHAKADCRFALNQCVDRAGTG